MAGLLSTDPDHLCLQWSLAGSLILDLDRLGR